MRTSLPRALAFSLLWAIVFGLTPLFSQISGAISNDTTWSTGTVIADSVYVPAGKTLTIQPGTIVKFNTNKTLVVAGILHANGTSGSPITFTANSGSPTPGSWYGIEFQNTSNVGSILDYCTVLYAGAGPNAAAIFYKTGAYAISLTNCTIRFSSTNGVNVRASSPTIKNSTFDQNGNYGIFSDFITAFVLDSSVVTNNTAGGIRIAVNATPSITRSRVDSNGVGIYMENGARPTITNNYIRKNSIGLQFTGIGSGQPSITADTIVGNTQYGFYNSSTTQTVLAERNYWGSDTGPYSAAYNPTGQGDVVGLFVDFQPWSISATSSSVTQVTATPIAGNTTWTSGVYWVKNSITVNGGVTLTINPGVIVKFAPGARLLINGALSANGQANNMIIFTSEKDDSYGGDSNGDGTATGPNPGDWDCVYMNGGGASSFSYCIFKFGGSGGDGNVFFTNISPNPVTNIYSTNSSNYGLYLSNANPTINYSTFGGNGSHGILSQGNSRFSVHKCVSTGNGAWGIDSDGGTSASTLVSMDSSNISRNGGGGVYSWYATGIQTFSYNRVDSNGASGVWSFNVGAPDTVRYLGNTIIGNGEEGIVTSRAFIASNTIQNNRYPIALLGKVNSTYSGNTITGNAYNNTIALRLNRYEESYLDTLKAVFPSGMPSPVYTVIENAPGWGLVAGNTLVIQPGVIIKMASTMYWRIEGSLKADASSGSPIVFTSYRDSTYGGKTNLPTDYSKPAPNDWRYIRIRTATSVGTVLKNVVFKFGGMDGYANLWIESQASLTTPVTNVISRKSSAPGIRTGDSQVSFTGITIDSCAGDGLYSEGSSPNGSGISTGSDITIQNSTITDNGGIGLHATSGSAFRQISNCTIRRNTSWGVGIDNGNIQQSFSGNTITNNTAGGIYNYSPTVSTANLQYIGNTVTDHGDDGILSTGARFVDNTIQRNRYPIGMWGRLGSIFVDNNGVDGNIISGNSFNNAISLRGAGSYPLSDTLRNVLPVAITSKTYVLVDDIQVNNGSTLVIQPGVNVKFSRLSGRGPVVNVYGTLNAQGTQANPIIFTSWHDSTAGAKTAGVTDWGVPAPGDIYYFAFRSGAGNSIVRYCQFKFGGGDGGQAVYCDNSLGSMVFSNNLVRKSAAAGIIVNNTPFAIDSTTVDSCASYGIHLNGNAAASVALTNSRIAYNGSYGLWASNPSSFTKINNCTIVGNNATGAYIELNGNPGVALRVVGTTVNNNNGHGLYFLSQNDAVDTLILFNNCRVFNNANTGVFSSRACFLSDSIYGNRYAVGLVGQLSRDSTGNVLGNVYRTNVVFNNTFNKTLVTEGTIFGKLGGSFLEGDTAKVVTVRGDAFVASGSTLTVMPGTVVKFAGEYGNRRIEVQGVLKSEGTASSKIVFTSWKDDSYGGDSNVDTTASVPAPGDWDMLYLNGANNNNSHIFNTIVRYGNRTNNGDIRMDNNSAPIDSSYISFSGGEGVYLVNSSPTITTTEIHHNLDYAVRGDGTSNPVLHLNNIHDNTNGGVFNYTTNTWNATNNYWGAASGPYKNQLSNQNLTGTGNRIYLNSSGDVTYIPFLTTRSGILLGDVSQNGTITSFDASLILREVVGPSFLTLSQKAAADVSGDATVSAYDASLILQYVVGAISGFPGLGKTTVNSNFASAFDFQVKPGADPDEIRLTLHLNGKAPLSAAEVKVAYDSTLVSTVEATKTDLSNQMLLESRFSEDTAYVAMAGSSPIAAEGDLVTMTFRLKDKSKDLSAVKFKIVRLVLNETDVTPQAPKVVNGNGESSAIPTTFGLSQNYPNPFNPSTTVEYQLPVSSRVTVKIFDLLGHEIRTIAAGEQKAGYYRVVWDGRDNSGLQVASSVYFYRIQATGIDSRSFTTTRKMMLLK